MPKHILAAGSDKCKPWLTRALAIGMSKDVDLTCDMIPKKKFTSPSFLLAKIKVNQCERDLEESTWRVWGVCVGGGGGVDPCLLSALGMG